MAGCLLCGDTGTRLDGSQCECGVKASMILPSILNVPAQYQNVRFDRSFLPSWLQNDYGVYMEELIRDITRNVSINKNILICAPPNSGKTVFAYTVYGTLFAKGMEMPTLRDIIEVRELFLAQYRVDYDAVASYSGSKLAIIKIPLDLPNKFPETISTIIERRVRNSCSTIFLYSGSKFDLLAQDNFGRLKSLEGDGSYNSLSIKSWHQSLQQ